MSRRHLSREEAQAALRRGKPIESFLGVSGADSERTIRYVILVPERNAVRVSLYEVLDVGSPEELDLYSFPAADGEDGLPVAERVALSPEDALVIATDHFSAQPESFVNQGVCQDEYRDHLLE